MLKKKKRFLWIANMVPHYNRELFKTLASRTRDHGIDFYLLSGMGTANAVGRSGLKERVIHNEVKFLSHEWQVGNYCVRIQRGIMEYVQSLRPDVIVSASQVGNLSSWYLMAMKRKLNFRLAAWQCGYEYNPSRLKNLVLAKYIQGFDFHLAYHTNAKNYALAHGARPEQITVMHNTLNEKKILLMDRGEAKNRVLEMHPEVGECKILLYVGAVLKEKCLDAVLEALDLLGRNDLLFMVVGDGPYLSTLRTRYAGRQDLLLAGQVIEGSATYFDAADIFILPGTGGLAINEAMAHSLPILSGYADGSADDLVLSGQNGFRLLSAEPGEIAEKLKSLLDNDGLRVQMGKKSRQILLEHFSFHAFIDRICRVVEKLAYSF